jgi:deferrochelatase/peroxidase EfeB
VDDPNQFHGLAADQLTGDKLATFEAKFPDAHLGAVVAFGNNTWRALSGGVGAEELKDFPGYGKGLAPTTQFDVLIHILSLRHDVNFSVAQAAMEAFGDCIEVKEEIHHSRVCHYTDCRCRSGHWFFANESRHSAETGAQYAFHRADD